MVLPSIPNYIQLYNAILGQNEALLKQQTATRDTYSTADQAVFYQSQQTQYLDIVNYYLMILYYVFVLVVIYVLFFKQTWITSRIYKGLFVVAVAIYPFVIPYIELFVYNLIMYLFSLVNGNVYTN